MYVLCTFVNVDIFKNKRFGSFNGLEFQKNLYTQQYSKSKCHWFYIFNT